MFKKYYNLIPTFPNTEFILRIYLYLLSNASGIENDNNYTKKLCKSDNTK